MLKQSIGMTENNAKQIAEMYLSRYNPTYWDGSGKVPSEVIFEICRVAVDSMYNGCTLEIQLCKIDACPCYAASIHLFEGGFWTGHGIGCFVKTALCYDIGSVHSLASAIMRICATYENLTNFRKVFVERLVISKERMNEIKQYTDGGKKQDEIEFESVTFADGMCMDVRCVPRKAMVLRWARLRNSPTGLKWTSAAAAARTILGLRLSCTIIPARKLSPLNPAMALPAAGN